MNNFNIKLCFQVPKTPQSYFLDVRIWCRLQATIEKDILYAYMWCSSTCSISIRNLGKKRIKWCNKIVFNRLKIVLVLIIKGNGGNKLVEIKRRKGFCNLDLTMEKSHYISIDIYQINDDKNEHINEHIFLI